MATARVAHLATASADLRPHVVPATYVVDGDTIVMGIDQKPKTTYDLRRLRNVAENPRVAILCDHYDDEWSQLWWVRADGVADIVSDGGAWSSAVELLTARYEQYRSDPPRGPVIRIHVDAWSGWSYNS